jgi:hypothetical protein
MKRRNEILSTYLPAVNPIASPRLENNRLTFENAAVAADVAQAPASYRAAWFAFDNATGDSRPLAETASPTTTVAVPDGLPTATGSFIALEISAPSRSWRCRAGMARTTVQSGVIRFQRCIQEQVPHTAGTPTYPVYFSMPRHFGLSVIEDQQGLPYANTHVASAGTRLACLPRRSADGFIHFIDGLHIVQFRLE